VSVRIPVFGSHDPVMELVFLKLRISSDRLYPEMILMEDDFIYRVSEWMEMDLVTKTLPLPAR
jgi:hypothetical protein